MLSVRFLQDQKDLYSFEFIEDMSKKISVVCPNPQLADDVRAHILSFGACENFESLTISKFIKDELSATVGEEILEKRVQKADLLLILGTTYKTMFPDKSYELFMNCFNLFTEMRSFTLKEELMDEVLSFYNEETKQIFIIFWKVVESLGLIDEQNSYKVLTDFYNGPEIEDSASLMSREIIFYGFTHLSGTQIDYVKSLSNFNNVYIPMQASLKNSLIEYDWLTWLGEEIEGGSAQSIEPLTSNNLDVIRFTKGRAHEKIKEYQKRETDYAEQEVFLIGKGISFYQYTELPFKNTFFKAKTDIFTSLLSECFEGFYKKLELEKSIITDDFCRACDARIEEALNKSFEDKNFRKLKVLALVKNEFQNYLDQSEKNNTVEIFDLKMIDNICQLKLPRNFLVPMSKSENKVHLKGIESLDSNSEEKLNYIIGNSSFRTIKDSDDPFQEEIMEVLRTYGPVRRNRVEIELVKQKLIGLLSQESSVLFLEDGCEKSDPFWEEVLSHFTLNNISLTKQTKLIDHKIWKNSKIDDSFQIEQVSPSKLQTYLDCPRKYFVDYIQRGSQPPKSTTSLEANQLGSLEHKIIEEYFGHENKWSKEKHQQLVKSILNAYLAKNKIKIDNITYKKSIDELEHLTSEIILVLLKIQKNQGAKLYFEKEIRRSLENVELYGKVDCVIEFDEWVAVIDFKRSDTSIPSKQGVLNYDKVQIWSYANNLIWDKPIKTIGFINLKDVDQSLLFTDTKDSYEIFENIKINMLGKPLVDHIAEYKIIEDQIINNIICDTDFRISPKTVDACKFCRVAPLCERGQG